MKTRIVVVGLFCLILQGCTSLDIRSLEVFHTGAGFGSIVAIRPAGAIDCPPTCYALYGLDSTVTLKAVPDAQSAFASGSLNWDSACELLPGPLCRVTMDRNRGIFVNFTTNRMLSLTFWIDLRAIGIERVSVGTSGRDIFGQLVNAVPCTGTCTVGPFQIGTVVTIDAFPPPSSWADWGECAEFSGNTCTITIRSGTGILVANVVW